MITSAPMMEGTCQTCIKQLIDAKELELAHPTQSASDQTTQEEAAQSQSTGERSFAQFQKASNNLKDWRAFKQNFREDKSMERQRFVLSATKPLGASKKEYQFQAKIAMYHQGRISRMNLPAASKLITIPIDSQTNDPTYFYNVVLTKIYSVFQPEIHDAAGQLPPFPASTKYNERYFYIATIGRPVVEITTDIVLEKFQASLVVEKFQGSLKTFELVFKADKYKNDHPQPKKATKTKKRSNKSNYREELSTSDEELDRISSEGELPARKKKKVEKKKPATKAIAIDSDTDKDNDPGPSIQTLIQTSPSHSSRPVVAKTNLCYESSLSDQFMGSIVWSPPKSLMPAIPSSSYETSAGEMCILHFFDHIIHITRD